MMLSFLGFGAARLRLKSRLLACGAAFAVLSLAPTQSSAQSTAVVVTAAGPIAKMLSDWNSNSLLIQLGSGVPFLNPAGCAATDFYETNPSDSAAVLNHSILLSAYMSHASLALVIQGCSFSGRPHIIGVSLPN